jgi:hypothetical protein
MNKTTSVLAITLLVAAACGKGGDGASTGKATEGAPKANYVPCEAAALDALSADLDTANCVNVDLTKKEITDACAAKAKEVTGKTYALEGCTFSSQGNDEVSFGAAGTDKTVHCVMKGGEAGVKTFRQAAMKLDMAKLKIDVVGTVAMNGDKNFERLKLTECQMTAHE